MRMKLYDIMIEDIQHKEISMQTYEGKVLLIVNTASKCGLTPQYEGLEALYAKYKDQGFEILAFPCNQFMNQAPGTAEEEAAFCQLNYKTNFQSFSKLDVNGANTHPLFKYLKDNAGIEHSNSPFAKWKNKLASKGILFKEKEISWNFTKFLIDRHGKIVGRYAPTLIPSELDSIIDTTIQEA
jgi:glutathione peroxidase